jgi:hypothetical protein
MARICPKKRFIGAAKQLTVILAQEAGSNPPRQLLRGGVNPMRMFGRTIQPWTIRVLGLCRPGFVLRMSGIGGRSNPYRQRLRTSRLNWSGVGSY